MFACRAARATCLQGNARLRSFGLSRKGETCAKSDVLFFIAISPVKTGGIELFGRRLAEALARRGRSIAFCFATPASEEVRGLFNLPNMQLLSFAEQNRFSWKASCQLWRMLRQLGPSVVVYSFGGILRPLPWICRLAGCSRVIYNDHASRVAGDEAGSALKSALARLITVPVDSVIAVSEFVATCSRSEKLHSAPVVAIPNGVDLSRRTPCVGRGEFLARYGIPPDRKIVSQLSWLVPEKGVDTFLAAAAKILACRQDLHFLVGGEGAGRDSYQRLAQELRIQDHVTFTGKLNDPMRSGFYHASEIFCLASRWQEACGLVLLEAMSAGVPVVASAVGGIPEYVRDGIDGLLVKGGAAEFAAAVSSLLDDEGLRRRMGTSAQKHVDENFSLLAMAERYAVALDERAPQPVPALARQRTSSC